MPLRLGWAGALAVMLAAGGCSDWFSSDDALYTGPSGVTLRADETFPSLASVPSRPQTVSSEEERAAALAEGRPLGIDVGSSRPATPTVTQPAPTPPASQPVQAQPAYTPPPARTTTLTPSITAQATPALPQQSYTPQIPPGTLLATIHFAVGSDNLDARDRSILRDVVTIIGQTNRTVTVVGHASAHTAVMDPMRARAINYDLSVQRARAVAQALVNLGAPASHVLVHAVGDSQPLFHEWMATGLVGNQRAEIYLN